MLRKYTLLLLTVFVCTGAVSAQSADNRVRSADKSDIINFHRQILSLKEYNEERAKIPALQKANKVTVKVKAIVDTSDMASDTDDDGKPNTKLTGYIRREIGQESIDVYQLSFDRIKKKITAVVPVTDSTDAALKSVIAPGTKKTAIKKTAKKSDDDEDDDDEDEKQPHKKNADKDDDN